MDLAKLLPHALRDSRCFVGANSSQSVRTRARSAAERATDDFAYVVVADPGLYCTELRRKKTES